MEREGGLGAALPAESVANRGQGRARALSRVFLRWYNTQHLHSAIRFVTPNQRHLGQEEAILANRQRVYEEARCRNPERWSGSVRDCTPVGEVRLNPERQLAEKAEMGEAA